MGARVEIRPALGRLHPLGLYVLICPTGGRAPWALGGQARPAPWLDLWVAVWARLGWGLHTHLSLNPPQCGARGPGPGRRDEIQRVLKPDIGLLRTEPQPGVLKPEPPAWCPYPIDSAGCPRHRDGLQQSRVDRGPGWRQLCGWRPWLKGQLQWARCPPSAQPRYRLSPSSSGLCFPRPGGAGRGASASLGGASPWQPGGGRSWDPLGSAAATAEAGRRLG